MAKIRSEGYTIVEVMLFLAITGILVATLLGGWTVLISTQRYKDSVDTTFGYLQDQYNLTYNVENERASSFSCDSSGVSASGGTKSRGQSDCVLLGRYIVLKDGTDFMSYAVVGSAPTMEPIGTDESVINAYAPKVVTESIGLTESSLTVPWGAVIEDAGGTNTPQNIAILILRTPTNNGTVHTYTTNFDGTPSIDSTDVTAANANNDVKLCFDAQTFVRGAGKGVIIKKNASSRNSVEILADIGTC